ncbi:pseudouridine synthase family protein [Artemisia annua]|uniref:Pseudouridine synthase family protein n=1 Tax=Artemisia annua TaxID=35608 RepID=A0A2U1MUP2_ARTAN|nr:pseudouridine synthase family protein [Artemisia annua]
MKHWSMVLGTGWQVYANNNWYLRKLKRIHDKVSSTFVKTEQVHEICVIKLLLNTTVFLEILRGKPFVLCFEHITGTCNQQWLTEKLTMKSTRFEKRAKIYRSLASEIINEDEAVIDQPIGTLKYPRVAKGLYVASPSGFLVVGDPLYVTGGKPQCYVPEIADETFAEDGGYHRPSNPVPKDCGYYLHAHQLVLCHPRTNEGLVTTFGDLESDTSSNMWGYKGDKSVLEIYKEWKSFPVGRGTRLECGGGEEVEMEEGDEIDAMLHQTGCGI